MINFTLRIVLSFIACQVYMAIGASIERKKINKERLRDHIGFLVVSSVLSVLCGTWFWWLCTR